MGMSVVDAVKEIQARDSIFVAYSQVTKLPYVTCAEETYNDQAWFFAEEETLKELSLIHISCVLWMPYRYYHSLRRAWKYPRDR